MDFAQLGDRDVSVDLRGIESRMAEEFLDGSQIRAVVEQVRGAGMAQ